jgi:hypothetical protein
MRTLTSWMACLLMLIATADSRATQACVPPAQQRQGGLAHFADDDGFDVQVRPSPDGSIIRVTGDTIIIDRERLASLVAPSGAPKTAVARLTFDARVLRIRGPLSLEGGNLVLYGQRVSFEDDGAINLLRGKRTRSLQIVAQTLVFNGGPDRPFLIDQDTVTEPALQVTVRAVNVASDGPLWQRFVDAYMVETQPANVSIITGAAAQADFDKTFTEAMEWPLYFAAKLQTHFQRSPYAGETRDEIGPLARDYQPLLSRWRRATPVATSVAVAAAVSKQTDINGRTLAFTPKEDLINQMNNIQKEFDGNSLDLLIELLAASGNDLAAAVQKLEDTRKLLGEASQSATRKRREIIEHGAALARLEQSKQGLLERTKQRSEALRIMTEQDIKKMRDGAQFKQWTTVAAGAVVIAASMGAATPAVAAGTAAGLSLTGDLVYANSANSKMTLAQVVTRGQDAYKNAQAFESALGDAGKAEELRSKVAKGEMVLKGDPPEAGKPDTRKPYTKTEATFALLGALGSVADAAGKLNGQDVAIPSVLSLTDRENEDEEMKALLTQIAEVEKERALEAETVQSMARELLLLTTRTTELEETDEQLRAADAKNDQEATRWHAASLLLWSRQVDRISGMLATYRRSLYFESGRSPSGAPEVLDYPNALQARIANGVFDPFGGVGPASPKDVRRSALVTSKNRFIAAAKELHASIAVTYKDYLQTRNEADVYRRVFDFSSSSTDPIQQRFIAALNGQIAQQIVGRSPGRLVTELYIPMTLEQQITPIPERIVSVRVVDIEFTVPKSAVGNGAIGFVVIHPNFGEMRRGAECFPADFRVQPTDWRRFTTTLEQVDPGWARQKVESIVIDEGHSNRYYTYLPARAPYHLLVNVVSANWVALPKIKKISIGLEVMQ